MSRLIDADALLNDITSHLCGDCDKRKGMKNGKYKTIYKIGDAPCRACEIDSVMDWIDSAPTVDAVEVVRCEKCKYLQESGHCDKLSLWVGNKEDGGCDDFFCGYGERKTE